MIAFAVVALLVLVAAAFVLAPVVRARRTMTAPRASALTEAVARKRVALAAILDLEGDHDMGKLSDADLEALRRGCEAEALDALRAIDALEAPSDADVEREIAQVRARLECPACGGTRPRESACPRCGNGPATERA